MMGFKNLFLILTLASSFGYYQTGLSQEYYIKINTPEDEIPMGSIENQNNGLYSLIWRGQYNPDHDPYPYSYYFFDYRNVIYNIDPEGSLIDSLEIDTIDGNDLILNNFIKAGDSLQVWGSAYNIENATVQLALLWLDFELNIIDFKLLGTYSDTTLFMCYTPVNEGNMVFGATSGINADLVLVKTNGSGNMILDSYNRGWAGPFPNIAYLPSTDQIICGRYHWIGYIENSDLMPDTAYYPLDFYFISYGYYKSLNESHCILASQMLNIPYGGHIPACLTIDTVAQMTDSITFELPFEENDAIEVDYINPDTIFLGAIENSYFLGDFSFDPVDRWIALFKFNLSGEKFWDTHFGGHGNCVLTDIVAMSDGGCALLGTNYDWRGNPDLERDVIIYRVDSEGILTDLPESKNGIIQIFPNPASDEVMISFPEDKSFKLNSGTVQVYDIQGDRLLSIEKIRDNEIIVNISSFAPGIYVVRINDDKNLRFCQKLIVY